MKNITLPDRIGMAVVPPEELLEEVAEDSRTRRSMKKKNCEEPSNFRSRPQRKKKKSAKRQ